MICLAALRFLAWSLPETATHDWARSLAAPPGLLTATRPHPWWLNANPITRNFARAGANAGNAGKSPWIAPHERNETSPQCQRKPRELRKPRRSQQIRPLAATVPGASETAGTARTPAAGGVSPRPRRRAPSRSASPAALRVQLRWCVGRARGTRARVPASGPGSVRPGRGPNSAWAARSWAGSA